MEGPYLTRRQYMYGNTFFDQEVPYYNNPNMIHRLKNDNNGIYDSDIIDGNDVDPSKVKQISGIETIVAKTLIITLKSFGPEENKSYALEIGKRYKIVYVTDKGIKVADGYLRLISDKTPETICEYPNGFSEIYGHASYIAMDCSKRGVSIKRKIPIFAIREITPMTDHADYEHAKAPISLVKLSIMERLDNIIKDINTVDELKEFYSEIKSKVDMVSDALEFMSKIENDSTEPTNTETEINSGDHSE